MGLGTRLQIMQNKLVQQITSHADFDLTLPGKQKCAYFCITSDQDSTYDVLATLFTSFLSIKLVRLADRMEDRKLPVPMCFILDEFPNIGVIPDFKKEIGNRTKQGNRHEYYLSEYPPDDEPISGRTMGRNTWRL